MPNTIILTIPLSVFEFLAAIARAALGNAVPGDGVHDRALEAVNTLNQAISDADVIDGECISDSQDDAPQVPPQGDAPADEA